MVHTRLIYHIWFKFRLFQLTTGSYMHVLLELCVV